jgi:hypothetical protein
MVLMTKNWKKFTAEHFFYIFLDQKLGTMHLSLASIQDVQVKEEAFSSQKRTSSTSNMIFLYFFLLLWVIFALLDPDPDPDSKYGSGSETLQGGSDISGTLSMLHHRNKK